LPYYFVFELCFIAATLQIYKIVTNKHRFQPKKITFEVKKSV